MIVKIQVTADDIAKGKPGEACDCPVWHAVARALPRLLELDPGFSVGPMGLCTSVPDVHVELPMPVHTFMNDFDFQVTVKPFEFDLDVPDDLLPAGGA